MRAYRRKSDRGIGAATGSTLAAARAFYCDVLGGREVGRGRLRDGSSALRFVFGGALVATGPSAAHDRVTLVVDDDVAIAARCWDGGFKVRIAGSADDESIVVIDPFDLELELIRSGSQRLLPAVAARGG